MMEVNRKVKMMVEMKSGDGSRDGSGNDGSKDDGSKDDGSGDGDEN